METGIVLREHFPEWKVELSYVSISRMESGIVLREHFYP